MHVYLPRSYLPTDSWFIFVSRCEQNWTAFQQNWTRVLAKLEFHSEPVIAAFHAL